MDTKKNEILIYCRDCLGEGIPHLELLASIRRFPSELPYVCGFRRMQSAEYGQSLELIAESSGDWATSRYLVSARLLWSSTPSSAHGAVHFDGITHYIDVMPLTCQRKHNLRLNPEVVSDILKKFAETGIEKMYLASEMRSSGRLAPCTTPPSDYLVDLHTPRRFREN